MLRMRLAVLFLLLLPAVPAWGQPKSKSDEIKKKDAKDEAVVRAKDRVAGYASLREVMLKAHRDLLERLTFLDLRHDVIHREIERLETQRRSGPVAENILRELGSVADHIG